MERDFQKRLNQALDAEENGFLDQAFNLYNELHKEHPEKFEPLLLLGVLSLRLDDPSSAEHYLLRARAIAPNHAGVSMNLALSSCLLAKADDARSHIEVALGQAPDAIAVYESAAHVYQKIGADHEALKALSVLIEHKVASDKHILDYARLKWRMGDPDHALTVLSQQTPQSAKLLAQQFDILTSQYNWRKAVNIANTWLDKFPSEPARESLARALFEYGDIERAREVFAPLITSLDEISPSRALIYARICLHTQEYEEAEKCLKIACESLPENADTLVAMARLRTIQGDIDEAKKICENAIRLHPEHILAYNQLNFITRGKGLEPYKDKISTLANSQTIDAGQRAALKFALGDAAFRQEDIPTSLEEYKQANSLRRTLGAELGHTYSESQIDKQFEIFRYVAERLQASAPGLPDVYPAPIFVVGMPRSGTTLTEDIISRASNIIGTGELTGGPRIEHELLSRAVSSTSEYISAETLNDFAAIYQKQIPQLPENCDMFVDKMPGNGNIMLLLASIFPNAHFVYCLRRSFDTAISIYRHQFNFAYTWAHQLETIATYMEKYAAWCSTQARALGDRFTLLDYDGLVADPENGAIQLEQALSLPTGALAAPSEDKRAVFTFSSVQVRMPISKKSSDGGDHFRRHMQEFADDLDQKIYALWSDMQRVP